MNRYWIKTNEDSDLVILSPLTDQQPENSILYTPNNFIKPVFNTYPNPTSVIEGATEQDLIDLQKSLVPNEVALWKIRVIIVNIGLEQSIIDAINQLENPLKTAALYIWNYGNTIDRYSQTILFLQQKLQLTDNQIDDIFINANNIIL